MARQFVKLLSHLGRECAPGLRSLVSEGVAFSSASNRLPFWSSRSLVQACCLSTMTVQAVPTSKIIYALAPAPQHDREGHVECAARVQSILTSLKAADITPDVYPDQLVRLKGIQPATKDQIAVLHSTEMIERLQETVTTQAPTVVADFDDPDGITYVTSSSFDDALLAAGSALAVVDAVVGASKEAERGAVCSASVPAGYAIIRPPGHHATATEHMGFCLFNNVALAARHAQSRHGFKKVMILDFDVHHGNGTQDLFYADPSVLFMDMHEHDVWPGSGQPGETGEGAGVGATINIPMAVGAGDAAVRVMFDSVVAPAAARFGPDLILISAGYDAHWRDPLEKLNYQSATYHHLLTRLKKLANELCGGRLVVLLEGGYSLQGLSEGVTESFLALLGEPSLHPHDPLETEEPLEEVYEMIATLKSIHGL